MGYKTDFWLNVYDSEHEIEYEEWKDVIETVVFDDNDHWLKEFLVEIYCEHSDDAGWYNHTADMEKFSTKVPHLTLRLFGKGEDISDEWEKTFKDGQLIKNKHITDTGDMSKWLKRKHPSLYYRYMSTRRGKPTTQNDYYKLKGFSRGIEILHNIMINNSAWKIQAVWDRYWYQPNAEGQSRAALKGYASVVSNQPPGVNLTMPTPRMIYMLPTVRQKEIKLPGIIRYANKL